MTIRKARALTYAALRELQDALDSAEMAEDFLAHADSIMGRRENLLEFPFETGEPDPLDPHAAGSGGRDADNAPRVYEFLGAMDPANASDRRLWPYLAFVTYRDYMESRWPLGEGGNWKGRAATRWMMPRVNRESLVRHGIARLWWIASLTYDPKKEQPLSRASDDAFAYTRALLAKEDRMKEILEREAGAVPALVRCVLEHVAADPSRSGDPYMRALMKEVTLVYGYRDLAALGEGDVRAVVADAAPH